MRFYDRTDAGRQLAAELQGKVQPPAIVLALPRGGVPVAGEIAAALEVPMDVIGVRKIGAPGRPELGVGAVAEGGGLVLDEGILGQIGVTEQDVAETIAAERQEVSRRVERYREGRPLPALDGKTAVLVDDGLATGVTAKAAVRAVRNRDAERVMLAVPVCSVTGHRELAAEADEVVCLMVPERFLAVGQWYDNFGQTTDDEVVAALTRTNQRSVSRSPAPGPGE